MARLTRREFQIAVLIGRGMIGAEIAANLGISEQTVKAHLTNARGKTGARTSAQLAVTVALQLERRRVNAPEE